MILRSMHYHTKSLFQNPIIDHSVTCKHTENKSIQTDFPRNENGIRHIEIKRKKLLESKNRNHISIDNIRRMILYGSEVKYSLSHYRKAYFPRKNIIKNLLIALNQRHLENIHR